MGGRLQGGPKMADANPARVNIIYAAELINERDDCGRSGSSGEAFGSAVEERWFSDPLLVRLYCYCRFRMGLFNVVLCLIEITFVNGLGVNRFL